VRAWMSGAACRGRVEFCTLDTREQVSICATCPVTQECRAYAIATRATGLVMGGVVIGKQPLKA